MSAKESLARAEAQRDNLRIEKEIVKSSEGRILNELENVRRERHSQSMLMANLQAIQVMIFNIHVPCVTLFILLNVQPVFKNF